MRYIPRLPALLLALAVTACATPATKTAPPPSQAAAPAKPAGPTAMVAAANPLAVEAGVKVLKAGGTAVDAAVAVQSVLGLVEPQSSGVGGGAFMVFYDAQARKVIAYNGRETAPAGATPEMFLNDDGKPLTYGEAVLSGRSTGVPGAIAMLYLAHQQHGKLPWKDLFADGEKLGDDGFVVSPRLAGMIASDRFPQSAAPDVKAYFTKADGTKYQAGDILKNPAYAATLRLIGEEGPKAILDGKIARDIVNRLHEGPRPGTMTLEDLKSYAPKTGPAECEPYRVYVICTPPLPSGGPAVLEGMGILANTDIAAHGPDTAEGWYLFAEAERLMYADRDRYMGDPDFVDVPVAGLLDPAYLKARAALIGPTAGPPPAPGKPKGAGVRAPDATLEPGGTSHMVIVDKYGNAVSMTTTVESIFGSGRMVDGFFLNNQLTDFSWLPKDKDGAPAANAVAPKKRPRSSMSPTIVLSQDGRFYAAVGSPGGTAILGYVLKGLVAMLDWKVPVQEAMALPNMVARGPIYGTEVDKMPPQVVEGLAAKGVKLTNGAGAEGSGLHAIIATPNGLEGGADPRREGVAIGF
ncbi:gamma-glutamyltransferase [Phenylobacterium sp.]|uniref:gamma-glutamyltransferase n=1 Tax=Phenylobacterium sp. TaxID=1871053 RepID=UPI0035B14DA0